MSSQEELRRALFRRGHRVTQATLSRDIHELGLVKTAEGYKVPQGEEAEIHLPSIERLIQEFVYDVKTAQNLVVVKTSPGSAQPVSAAMDAEEWEEVVGTIGGDDTILAIALEREVGGKAGAAYPRISCIKMNTRIQPAVFGATGYSGFELVRLLARHAGVKKPLLLRRNGESGECRDLSEVYPQLCRQRRLSLRELLVAADERRRRGCRLLCHAARVLARACARGDRQRFPGD